MSTAGSIAWRRCHAPVDLARIEEVEAKLGYVFPKDFRAFIGDHHGGKPDREQFWYDDPVHGRYGSCLGALLSFDLGYEGNIVDSRTWVEEERLAARVIPFARDGGGDAMCFDFRDDPENPTVVYWCHDKEPEIAIVPLAPTFTAFLEMLTES